MAHHFFFFNKTSVYQVVNANYSNLLFLTLCELLVLQASLREEKKLRVENAKLKKEIEGLKQELIQAEIRNGGGDKSPVFRQQRSS